MPNNSSRPNLRAALMPKIKEAAQKAVNAGGAVMLREIGLVLEAASPGRGRVYRAGAIERNMSHRRAREQRLRGQRSVITASGNIRTRAIVGYRIRRASAPGDPWASDTGNARQSMTVDNRGDADAPRVHVGPATGHRTNALEEDSASYVEMLEYGTREVAARPTLRVAAQRGEAKVAETMQKVFRRELKR